MSAAPQPPAAEGSGCRRREDLAARAAERGAPASAPPRRGDPGRHASSGGTAGGARSPALEALRVLGGLALVFAAAALALWALDGVPTWIAGQPRGVRKALTVRDAERFLRARLVLPSYFPARFAWPPAQIRFLTGDPGAVALFVSGRDGGPGLLLAQTVAPGSIPPRLLPEAQELDEVAVAVGGSQGRLARVVEEGVVTWEVRWVQGGRSMLLRSRGGADELVRMARSAREAP